ncbi:MAG: 2-dehydropantoate 2-reductase [Betaproteobacteria bacterium]|nr:2-dehydropantoate 2-reductase [Betaproteobacteria bacterium]
MKVAVIGAGGVGGYFGARLAQAGHDVTFVARGRHLAAIREHGLAIESALGDATVRCPATDDLSALGPVDVAMLCVKLWDVEATAPKLAGIVSNGGVVIPFQNGVESADRVAALLGPSHVLGGVAYIAATIRAPGVIAHTGTMARLRVGAFPGGPEDRAAAFVDACRSAGVEIEHTPDIRRALWEKFVFLASFSGITSAARSPIGVVRSDPDLRALLEAAMREVWSVGVACGIALPDDFVAKQLAFADGLPAAMRSSMQNDLESGYRLEVPWLSGAVARMAREAGLAAPVHATLHAILKPFAGGRAA